MHIGSTIGPDVLSLLSLQICSVEDISYDKPHSSLTLNLSLGYGVLNERGTWVLFVCECLCLHTRERRSQSQNTPDLFPLGTNWCQVVLSVKIKCLFAVCSHETEAQCGSSCFASQTKHLYLPHVKRARGINTGKGKFNLCTQLILHSASWASI